MAAPIVQASSEKLRQLAELRAQKAEIEAARLAELDVFKLIGYTPHARQQEFHDATESDVLFGGSAGGGKSVALVAEGLKWCARYPKFRALLIRRSYDELEESIFPALRKFGYGEALGARFNSIKRELVLPNKSIFRFRYLESIDDASRRQGGEYMLVLADELGLLAPGILDFLRYERLRSDGTLPVIGVRATSNPGGPGHAEVKDRYLEPTEYGRKVYTDEHGLTVRFVRSKATDNPFLDKGYLKRLDAIPDPNRRAAMRDGDWSVFSGMVFPDFSMDRHVVEPMPLAASLRRYAGCDWGYTAPFCVLWGAVDEDGRVWLYREIYERQVGEAEQARMVLASEGDEQITARYADDAMWSLRGDAVPIASAWAQGGVHLTPAGKGPGSRIQGWQRIHSYLADGPACAHHRAQGLQQCPMLHVFSTCKALIREIRALPYATTGGVSPEDADPKADDHACLVAGTLVETVAGPRPIERVRAGDWVQTRSGARRVLVAGMTARNATVGTVLLSNGATLTGTANHPVWVRGHGWKRLDALRYSDILSICPAANQSYSTASPTGVTRTRKTGPTGCTSPPALPPSKRVSSGFTRKSGRQNTGRSPRVTMSTTRTTTPSTTTRPTWSASPRPSMTLTTPQIATTAHRSGSPTWRRSALSPLSGIGRMKAGRGTASTASAWRSSGVPSPSGSVSNAVASTKRPTSSQALLRGSAPTTARASGGACQASMTRRGPARRAAASSRSTGTRVSAAAPVSVLGTFASENVRRDVYNLTIDGAHEFYGNGVLLHNCDALRYLLVNLGGGATFYDSPPPGLPLGTPAPLAPMGRFAVAETPGEGPQRAPGSELNGRQGATQTWEQALAAMGR